MTMNQISTVTGQMASAIETLSATSESQQQAIVQVTDAMTNIEQLSQQLHTLAVKL